MNGMNFKPFIAKLLDSLSDEQVKQLYDLINSHSNNFKKRSLIDNSNLLTTSDKGIGLYTIQLDSETIKTGYLIYNDTQCVLLGYVSNSERVSEYVIDMTKKTWSMVKEFITTDYFRHEVAIRAVSVGELTEIEVDDINSASTPANGIIVSDGEGGAEWSTVGEVLSEDTEEGSAQYLLGIDSEGNVIKDELPEGIVVDQTVVEDSANAVSGGAVYDAIADINAELENKANVDGNYDTLGAGHANSATSLDTEVGNDDQTPFAYQTSGGSSDVETGQQELKKLVGVDIVKNQLFEPIADESGTLPECGVSYSISNGRITLNGTAVAAEFGCFLKQAYFIQGHLYLFMPNVVINSGGASQGPSTWQLAVVPASTSGLTAYEINNRIIQAQSSGISSMTTTIYNGTTVNASFDIPRVWDLTQRYGSNDIVNAIIGNGTDDEKVANLLKFDPNILSDTEFNTGTLVSSQSAKLKTVGYNQWDEEYLNGYYDENNDGIFVSFSNYLASKNPIRVLPNTTYYKKVPTGVTCFVLYYDINGTYLNEYESAGNTFTTPSNCAYIQFYCNYGTNTYNHDICIFIYWDGSKITYEPCEKHEYDLPNKELHGVLKVVDDKVVADGDELYPSGNGKTRYGTYIISNSTSVSASGDIFYFIISEMKYTTSDEDRRTGIFSSKFTISDDYRVDTLTMNDLSMLRNQQYVYIKDSSCADASAFLAKYTGTSIIYELATETELTNQGAFAESIFADDFGTMQFLNSLGNQIAGLQGAEIFYKANIAGFAESLYVNADGAPSNIVLKSDLTPYDNKDTQLLNAIGGTLRQCLCVKESLDFDNTAFVDLGTLTWYVAPDVGFYAQSTAWANGTHLLTTKYKTSNAETQGTCYISNGNFLIYDNSFNNDATAFKNAMKGVLLAYEKA